MTSTAPAASLSSTGQDNAEHRDLIRWQRRLLPFMSRFLVALALTFFVVSLVSVYEMRDLVRIEPSQAIRPRISELLQARSAAGPAVDVNQQGLLLLESDALDKRYRQASALLMSRIWTRLLAFLTGMVLSFIGAIFIIGKLSEGKTEIAAGAADWKTSISSSSPGLIIAFFGSVLMAIALVVQPPIEIQDRPVYLMTMGIVRSGSGTAAAGSATDKPSPDPFAVPGDKKTSKTE